MHSEKLPGICYKVKMLLFKKALFRILQIKYFASQKKFGIRITFGKLFPRNEKFVIKEATINVNTNMKL